MKAINFSSICVFIFISFMFFGCAPGLSSSFTRQGYTAEKFGKVAVVGISNNLNSRIAFERTSVSYLKENGVNAVQGLPFFPQNMTDEERAPQNIIKIIESNNLDAVITIALIKEEEVERFQEGNLTTVPAGYYRVGKYIYRRYVTIREPGYYKQEKSYVLEAVMYNVKGDLKEGQDRWVWTGQTSLISPSSLNSAAETFAKQLTAQLIKDSIFDLDK